MAQSKQSQIKLLIAKGKEQGYLTFAEVNDHLPTCRKILSILIKSKILSV